MIIKPSYVGVSILLSSSLIYAQTGVELEKVYVTDTFQKTNSMDIDLQSLQNSQANSLFDLFKNDASIDVGGGGISVQRIYLRGLESSSLNITLDGAKQGKNMFQHRGNELGVNPEILKQVEVKTYTDASDNSGALGGSIIMETKDAQDFITAEKTYGGIFKTGYGTNADTKYGSSIVYDVINPYFGIYANISGVNSNNYEDGKGDTMYATAYKDRDYFLKLSMLDYKDNTLKVSLGRNENTTDTQWGRLGSDAGIHIPGVSKALEKISSTTDTYALQHNYNPSKLLDLDTNLNLSRVTLQREDNAQEYENETSGLKVQNHFGFDLLSSKNRLTLGMQYEKEEGELKDSSESDDVESNNKAFFIQNRMNIDALNIYYGVRFDGYELKTGFGEVDDDTISPNIGFDYKLNGSSKIYANYGKSSRMTGIIPFTWMTNINATDSRFYKNLQAETSKKYELGYTYHQHSLFASEDFFSFDLNLFQTHINNLIASNGGPGGTALTDMYNNPNEFKTKGFEIKLLWSYEKYTANLSYTHIDSEDIKDSSSSFTGINEAITIRRVGGYDSRKLVWSNSYEVNGDLSLGYSFNAVKGINKQVSRGGYVTHDINIKYTPSSYKSLTLFAGIDNLTDKAYGKHTTIAAMNDPSVYRYEPGRNFKFSMKYTF
jgi:hemoglobin/transferrin/lactoferrin receptor protein